MKTFGFGQDVGKIVQTAYVVKNIHAAIDWWVKSAQTGPWFLLDHFLGEGQVYRGSASTADVAIAMAFAGSMCIELIQPLDDNPSVYKELIDKKGYGFHHLGLAVLDVDAEVDAYRAKGYELVFSAPVPTGGAVAYLDNGVNDPGYLELIPATPGMDETFTRFWQASRDWDGQQPIRPFIG